MKLLYRILFLLSLTFFLSCEEKGWIVKCPDCTDKEPENAKLTVKLDMPAVNMIPVKLNVWEGNLEDSIIYRQLVTNPGQTSTIISVPVNKKYTVTATYTRNGDTYTAVDSAFPRIKYDEEQCDNPCYYVYDRTINLKLKYF